MLSSIFEWLEQAIAGGLDLTIEAFLKCLDLDLSVYLEAFPILADAYGLLQIVGLGMTLMIAAIGLYKFFLKVGDSKTPPDRPEQVLLKSAVAAGLIYFGGYILEKVTAIASLSYVMFSNLGAEVTGQISDTFTADSVGQAVKSVAFTGTVSELTLVTVSLILVALIAYNLFKLLLEVAERFMMVGVLVFTSPLIYCTISTSSTDTIFRSWVRMFFSSCLMMSFSAFFLKVIVNGLYAIEVGQKYFIQLLLVLAMCKIAQRTDGYLNQLGLTAAVTGGGMLDDIRGLMGIGKTIEGTANRAFNGKGSKNSVLDPAGSAVHARNDIRAGGPIASVVNGIKQGRNAFVNGATFGESVKSGAKAAGDTLKRTAYGGAVAGAVQAKKEGTNVVQGAAKGAATGLKEGVAQYVAPATMNMHRAAVAENQRVAEELRKESGAQRTAENAEAAGQASASRTRSAGQPMTEELRERIHAENPKPFTNSEADANFAQYGVAESGKSALVASGEKPMEEYRQEAVQQLKQDNEQFAQDYANYTGTQNGTYKEGQSNYMPAEDFEGKWGTTISETAEKMAVADASGDGTGMQLSDNALASGLTMQRNDAGQSYVEGREEQTGAFLANEYNRPDPVEPTEGIKTDAEYRNMAVQALAESPAAPGFDREQYIDDKGHMEKTAFQEKYGEQIDSLASTYRSRDISANQAANDNYRNIVNNTAEQASPNAVVHGFYDNGGTLEGNDRLGNTMMERGFSVITSDRAEGTQFSNVRAYDRPATVNEITGERLSGGRAVEATYTARDGMQKTVRVYDHTAYTSMTDMEKSGLHSYIASDGRQLWTTANITVNQNIGGNGFAPSPAAYSEPRVMSTSSRRTQNTQRRGGQQKTGHNPVTLPNKKKK